MDLPTARAIRAAAEATERVRKVHECGPMTTGPAWTARVSTPGFDESGGTGMSTWVCETCMPLVVEIITRHCGDAVIKAKDVAA